MVILAFGQWNAERLYREQEKAVVMPTEFNHIMGAIAALAKRPLLVLREKAFAERGVLRAGYLTKVVKLPSQLRPEWLDSRDFRAVFEQWIREIKGARHVFLGYSTQATTVAKRIRKFLRNTLKLSVFDWHDFRRGESILESIKRAERLTQCGIFMFMADDKLAVGERAEFVPRDNVIYEAGYFAGAKGDDKSIIIFEEGAKVPTDLLGILNIMLKNRQHVPPVLTQLRDAIPRILSGKK